MFVYVGKNFTATLTGRRIVEVCCDKCQTQFFYELLRQATGTASAPYYIGQDAAARRAQKLAQKNLDKKLNRESDLVACPECKWVNQELIDGYRRIRYRWVTVVSTLLAIAAWVAALIYLNESFDTRTNAFLTNAGLSLIPMFGVVVAGYGLQGWLRRLINPNRDYPNPPRLPPGMPKAWTTAEMAVPAEMSLEMSPPLDHADDPFPGWAMFRAGHLAIPPHCCECLGPATTLYQTPFKVNENDTSVPAPLCVACASRLRRKWWLHALLAVVGAAVLGGVFYLIAGADEIGRIILASIIFLFAALIGAAVIPNRLVQPYQLKIVDRARSLFRIKFRNDQYTAMVRRACAEHEEASFPRIEVPLEPMPED